MKNQLHRNASIKMIEKKESHKQSDKKLFHIGLLILRIGIGIAFILHGVSKWLAGPDEWFEVGHSLSIYGIHFAPMVFGFGAIFLEIIGGIFLIIGLLLRTNCLFLLVIISISLGNHISYNDSFLIYSHTILAAILFLILLVIGPGKYTLGNWLLFKR